VALVALFLVSCGGPPEPSVADLVHITARAPTNFRTIEFTYGEVSRSFTSQASVDFDIETIIFVSDDVGILKELHAYNRMNVSKGDILVEIEYDEILLNDELEKLRLNIENAERALENEKIIRQENIRPDNRM